jgi:hypothetical protein
MARAIATFTVVLPGLAVEIGKVKLRPLYRKLFGVRRVQASKRV